MTTPAGQGPEAIRDLVRVARAVGSVLTEAQQNSFTIYIEALLLWRTRLSLTTADTAILVVRSHIADSLPLIRYLRPGSRVADIGSGAGFPGVPLAISYPAAHVTLVESRRKRANFLREVVRQTKMKNVSIVEGRAEGLIVGHEESFDIIVSRALGPLADFLFLAQPLLKRGGLAIAMKGPRGRAEAATSAQSGLLNPEISDYQLPGGAMRTLLAYRKPV